MTRRSNTGAAVLLLAVALAVGSAGAAGAAPATVDLDDPRTPVVLVHGDCVSVGLVGGQPSVFVDLSECIGEDPVPPP